MTTFSGPFSPEHRDSWNAIAKSCAIDRPSVGKRVRVIEGRKYKGLEGIVTWHGYDKYANVARYEDAAQGFLREMMGRYGYRIRIVTDDGEAFFVSADSVDVLEPRTAY